jgi:DNA-binding MarR family transcriptional regulator
VHVYEPIRAENSLGALSAWDLTRRLSPRDLVRVMKRDAYGRLDENSYPSAHRVGPHSPTTPWAMYLADSTGTFRVLCFDFDGKDKHGVDAELMEQAHDQCDALSSALSALAIAHVVCQSSGTGGRHIWVALRDGASAAQVAAVATAARLAFGTLDHGMLHNSRTGAARPPLSPHRDGSASTVLRGSLDTLTTPSTTVADLAALAGVLEQLQPAPRAADSAPSGPVDARHQAHRTLSRAGTAHMATIDGGSNPSWTGFMCLLAAANAGWTLRDVEHAAKTAPGMEHYRTKNTGRGGRRPRGAAEARSRLERQWDKAQQYAAVQRPLPAEREPRDLTELTAIVADVDDLLNRFRVSPGRWGRTESALSQRTILTALAYLTLQTGKRVVAASIRDLALMGGLGRTTASDALRALSEAGFAERVTTSDGGNAAEWRLTPDFSTAPRRVRSQPLNNPRPPTELFTARADLIATLEQQLTDQRHDLFTRAGLGHLAGKLYAMLRQFPALTIDTATRILGVSHRHTATILSRLRHHRLIVKHPDGWARSKRDLRDLAARALGVAGTLLDRAERYRAERDVWAWWQAELATMTTAPRHRPQRPHVSSRTLEFVDERPGERSWPRYPRAADGRGDHREARYWSTNGMLSPVSLWWSAAA